MTDRQIPGQGELFDTHQEGLGPGVEGGDSESSPADVPTVNEFAAKFADPELLEIVKEQNKHDRNRAAQLGRHTALDESGAYTDVRPGKVLPGFGIVRESNLALAKGHAKSLNAKKEREARERMTDEKRTEAKTAINAIRRTLQ